MEGYLGQIAERQNSIMHTDDMGIYSINPPRSQEASLIDPFENIENNSDSVQPKKTSQSVIPTISNTDTPKNISPKKVKEKNTIQTSTIETSYISRHINRITTQHQYTPDNEKLESPVKTPITKSGEIFQNEVIQQPAKIQKAAIAYQPKLIQPNNSFEESAPHSETKNKSEEQNSSPETIKPRTSPQYQSEKQSINDFRPVSNEILPTPPISRMDKMGSPEKFQTNAPKLVIGKINVEIISVAKPQIINKIERVITEKNTAPPTVRNRFIFGLDQL